MKNHSFSILNRYFFLIKHIIFILIYCSFHIINNVKVNKNVINIINSFIQCDCLIIMYVNLAICD